MQLLAQARWRGGRVRLKATVSKTVMGHWPIESSNLSLSAFFRLPTVRWKFQMDIARSVLPLLRGPSSCLGFADARLSGLARPGCRLSQRRRSPLGRKIWSSPDELEPL